MYPGSQLLEDSDWREQEQAALSLPFQGILRLLLLPGEGHKGLMGVIHSTVAY
jgi:hypothetical protein